MQTGKVAWRRPIHQTHLYFPPLGPRLSWGQRSDFWRASELSTITEYKGTDLRENLSPLPQGVTMAEGEVVTLSLPTHSGPI